MGGKERFKKKKSSQAGNHPVSYFLKYAMSRVKEILFFVIVVRKLKFVF